MAYPTYYPNAYQQPYYGVQGIGGNAAVQPQLSMPFQQNNQPTSNGVIWVQGEAGAKSYLVAPGTTVLLMDSETHRFFLKSTDSTGMPLPLKTFYYKEKVSEETPNLLDKISEPMPNEQNFVTRDEFEALRAEFAALTAKKPAASQSKGEK